MLRVQVFPYCAGQWCYAYLSMCDKCSRLKQVLTQHMYVVKRGEQDMSVSGACFRMFYPVGLAGSAGSEHGAWRASSHAARTLCRRVCAQVRPVCPSHTPEKLPCAFAANLGNGPARHKVVGLVFGHVQAWPGDILLREDAPLTFMA